MIFGDMIFDTEVVKQRFRTTVLTHHDEQRTSTEFDFEQHYANR